MDIDEMKLKAIVREVMKERDLESPRITKTDVKEACDESIRQSFTAIGIDTSTDDAMTTAQKDHHFLRRMRRLHDIVGRYVAIALVSIVVATLLYFASMWHKDK